MQLPATSAFRFALPCITLENSLNSGLPYSIDQAGNEETRFLPIFKSRADILPVRNLMAFFLSSGAGSRKPLPDKGLRVGTQSFLWLESR